MAKKKKKIDAVRVSQVDLSNIDKYENKYIGIIKELVKDETNLSEMMRAVAHVNSRLLVLTLDEEKVRAERDQIIEAYNYAAERMLTSEENERKILENWFGDYPLLFRLGSTLEYEKEKERINFEYTLLSKEQKELAKKIFDATWSVRENRRFFVLGDSVRIPRTIPRNDLEMCRYLVNDLINTFLLAENASFIFALERPHGDVLSALRNVNGRVSVVSPKELAWCYSHDPATGEVIGNPPGEKYVEFDVEL